MWPVSPKEKVGNFAINRQAALRRRWNALWWRLIDSKNFSRFLTPCLGHFHGNPTVLITSSGSDWNTAIFQFVFSSVPCSKKSPEVWDQRAQKVAKRWIKPNQYKWRMAISWAWLYQSDFQLISIALPAFRPAKLKVDPSSAHKQHLKQEDVLSGRMRQKEKEGFTKMKARTGDNGEDIFWADFHSLVSTKTQFWHMHYTLSLASPARIYQDDDNNPLWEESYANEHLAGWSIMRIQMKLQKWHDEVPNQVTEEVSAHGPSPGPALSAAHTKPTNPRGREDGLVQRGGAHDVTRAGNTHGLHHAHIKRNSSRMDRERRNPPACSPGGKAEGLLRDWWEFCCFDLDSGRSQTPEMWRSSLWFGFEVQSMTASVQLSLFFMSPL